MDVMVSEYTLPLNTALAAKRLAGIESLSFGNIRLRSFSTFTFWSTTVKYQTNDSLSDTKSAIIKQQN